METREGVDFDVAGSVHQFRDRIVVFADPSRLAYLPPFTRRCKKVKVLWSIFRYLANKGSMGVNS